MTTVQERIRAKCVGIAERLMDMDKNELAAELNPARVFCRGRASDLLRVRIDAVLARIKNSRKLALEEEIKDLICGLILLLLAIEDEGEQ